MAIELNKNYSEATEEQLLLEVAGEIPEEQIRETFRVTDEASANWVMRKINEQVNRIDDAERFAAGEAESANRIITWFMLRFGPEMEEFAKRQLVDGKKKSIKLPAGKMGFRTQPDAVQPEDLDDYMTWVKGNLPDALSVMAKADVSKLQVVDVEKITEVLESYGIKLNFDELISKSAVNEHFKSTGEVPDGCAYIPAREKFYIDN